MRVSHALIAICRGQDLETDSSARFCRATLGRSNCFLYVVQGVTSEIF
jgi:hypothetical protein